MKKRWVVAEKISEDLREQLLANRGLQKNSEIKKFSHAHLNLLTPAAQLFPHLEKAVSRLNNAIKNKELIYIYGDYDVDGVTASAILWETIDFLGGKVMPYIPSRKAEGYGLHSEALESLAREGAKVVVSVDCGITAVEQAEIAKKLGIDLIITDHHQPAERLPKPFALVHTTELSGSGVAFRLAEELLKSFDKETDEQFYRNLELATLGTISDMVPLVSDNRIIVKNGLKLLGKSERLGLKSLFEEAAIGKVVGTYEVGFVISPRLNAMGRLDSAMDSLRLLLTRNKGRARELALKLGTTNKERQEKTKEVFEHAKAVYEKDQNGVKFIVIDSATYPEGVVGLVASRLVEAYHRPTAVIGKGEKVFKGSARSISGFNITNALNTQKKLLESHGGHPMAAGFSIQEENIPTFRKNLVEIAEKELKEEDLVPILKIDIEISLAQINPGLEEILKEFEPFGVGNPEAVFLTKNLEVREVKLMGAEAQHLKMILSDQNGKTLTAVGFNLAGKSPKKGELVDLCYNIRENYWNSRKTLEARIKDLELSKPS
ncbi:MAG TPA: single-stranded-DNA-specific exonuclease RecJ [Candidatus Saccharimonadales bacterium]|nr:single-stranded-DNA-specific exonuclease RecJ [Candidatus Saccharimonadales bacterium]